MRLLWGEGTGLLDPRPSQEQRREASGKVRKQWSYLLQMADPDELQAEAQSPMFQLQYS